jgi:glycosyltransferase involved in cell wall biosynthesis
MTHAPLLDILIPTRNRPAALAITLAGVAAQSQGGLRVVLSDQSDDARSVAAAEVQAVLRLLQAKGIGVQLHQHLPRRGMAEQRDFLLAQARAPHCLFLDDDVIIETDLVARLLAAMAQQQCGFIGSALHGLSHLHDHRPQQQHIAFWDGKVTPETVTPACSAWQRHHLHSAANLFHVQCQLGADKHDTRLYRVAWVGGCVLFDTAKLRAAGGFNFWPSLPAEHCGEDVLAQLRVMAHDGGCAIFPSGAYHMELPTTVEGRRVNAVQLQGPP